MEERHIAVFKDSRKRNSLSMDYNIISHNYEPPTKKRKLMPEENQSNNNKDIHESEANEEKEKYKNLSNEELINNLRSKHHKNNKNKRHQPNEEIFITKNPQTGKDHKWKRDYNYENVYYTHKEDCLAPKPRKVKWYRCWEKRTIIKVNEDNEKKQVTDICKELVSNNGFSRHIESCQNEGYSCPKCEKKCSDSGTLKTHLNEKHPERQRKKYFCKYKGENKCNGGKDGQGFTRKYSRDRHEKDCPYAPTNLLKPKKKRGRPKGSLNKTKKNQSKSETNKNCVKE